jgi:hypothetical protein
LLTVADGGFINMQELKVYITVGTRIMVKYDRPTPYTYDMQKPGNKEPSVPKIKFKHLNIGYNKH